VRCGGFPVALGGNDGLDVCLGEFVADGIAVIAFVPEEGLDLVADHPKERRKPVDVVRLSWRQNEAERSALGIASGVEFGGKATPRSAERLGFLSPLFMPTAQ
jgi:hypothetical protein